MANYWRSCGSCYYIAINFATTRWSNPCGTFGNINIEAVDQFIVRDTYTWANLLLIVPTNTLNGATTIRSRVNAVNGNMSLSVAAAATGTFEDTTNSDSLVDGSLFVYQIATGGTAGTFYMTTISSTLSTVANNTPIIGSGFGSTILAGVTTYMPLAVKQLTGLAEFIISNLLRLR